MQFFEWHNSYFGDYDFFAILNEREKTQLVMHHRTPLAESASFGDEKYYYLVDSNRKIITPIHSLAYIFGGQYNDNPPYGTEVFNFNFNITDYKLTFLDENTPVASKTETMRHFSDLVKRTLNYYVYALIDPRNDEVFYIGKGHGDRVFQHEEEAKSEIESHKHERISDIHNAGFSVKKVIVLHNLTEELAFAAEASLINFMQYTAPDQLTNLVSGHHAEKAMTVEETELHYGAEPLAPEDISHNLLIIKINTLYRPDMTPTEIMDCARGHWVINIKNAAKADYLLAVYHGLVVGVYENMQWYSSGENTPFYPRPCDENLRLKNRKYCTCAPVPDSKYFHRNIEKLVKESQNPVSYFWKNSSTQENI